MITVKRQMTRDCFVAGTPRNDMDRGSGEEMPLATTRNQDLVSGQVSYLGGRFFV